MLDFELLAFLAVEGPLKLLAKNGIYCFNLALFLAAEALIENFEFCRENRPLKLVCALF